MPTIQDLTELAKALAPIVVAAFGYLKSKEGVDVYAASERAKKEGTCVESQMRWRWYHTVLGTRHRVKAIERRRLRWEDEAGGKG
jgi:hypothetical protein